MRIIACVFAFMFLTCPAFSEPRMGSPVYPSDFVQLHVKPLLIFSGTGTSIGPSVALEFPVARYISLGGAINASFLSLPFLSSQVIVGNGNINISPSSATLTTLDFNVIAKASYPLKIGHYDASLYGALPLGFSLAILSAERTVARPGFNFALVPGFEFFFDDSWGIFCELGFNLHVFGSAIPAGQFAVGGTYIF